MGEWENWVNEGRISEGVDGWIGEGIGRWKGRMNR